MEKRSLTNIAQLQGLVATLQHQEEMKKDLVVTGKDHLYFLNGELHVVQKSGDVVYSTTNHFHSQIAEKLNIPAGYYNKMLTDAAVLLDHNVNHWLKNESKNFLVRTFENAAENYNTARAFLSDGYSMIDNYQILMEALEAIKAAGVNIEVVNAELSETRMFLKVVCPEVEIDAKEMLRQYRHGVDTGIISGFTLGNSEVGNGAFFIMPRALVKTCMNGAVMPTDSLRRVHLGAKMDELGFNKNQNIVAANLRLIKEQIKHAVKVFLSKEYLQKTVSHYAELGKEKIQAPVQDVIQVIAKEYKISKEREANILKYFIEGGDTRRLGVASAMTFECQELNDADLKHDTEVASFEVLKNFEKIEAAALKVKRSKN